MAQPQENHGSEDLPLTDQLAEWVVGRKPKYASKGVREYETDDMKENLRKAVNTCMGTVCQSKTLLSF